MKVYFVSVYSLIYGEPVLSLLWHLITAVYVYLCKCGLNVWDFFKQKTTKYLLISAFLSINKNRPSSGV